MNTSITARDFYNLVLDATRDFESADCKAMYAYASDAIAKLDARNEKRRENAKPSKDSLESAARRQAVREFFEAAGSEQLFDRDAVAEALGITPGQATAAMTALVKADILIKVEGKGKAKTSYHLA